jgi:PST family polysaccharide transporter
MALLNRHMRFISLTVIDVSCAAVSALVGIAAAWNGFSYWSLVLMQATSSLLGLLLAWTFSGWHPSWPVREASVSSLLRFGANVTGANLSIFFMTSADNIIVGLFGGKTQLGLYDRAYKLVTQPLSQMTAPISRIALPLLSRLTTEPSHYRSAFIYMVQLILLASMPLMICNIFMSNELTELLLGKQWNGVAAVFGWISVGGLAAPIYSSAFWLFTSQNRTDQQMRYAVVTSAISVMSFAVGIHWNAIGVAAVSSITFDIIQTPLIVWAATRKGPVSLREIAGVMIPLFTSGGGTALVIGLYCSYFSHSSLLDIVQVYALAYFSFMSLFGMTPGGIRFFLGTWDFRKVMRGTL